MPVSRDEVRRNLFTLLQYQTARDRGYGDLLLAVWHDTEDEAEDVRLLEVYDDFASPEGAPRETYKFPGAANMWLPGLYELTVFSRDAFVAARRGGDAFVSEVLRQVQTGEAEVLFVEAESRGELLGGVEFGIGTESEM